MYGEVQTRDRIKLSVYRSISTKQKTLMRFNVIISIFIDKYRLLKEALGKEKIIM